LHEIMAGFAIIELATEDRIGQGIRNSSTPWKK